MNIMHAEENFFFKSHNKMVALLIHVFKIRNKQKHLFCKSSTYMVTTLLKKLHKLT